MSGVPYAMRGKLLEMGAAYVLAAAGNALLSSETLVSAYSDDATLGAALAVGLLAKPAHRIGKTIEDFLDGRKEARADYGGIPYDRRP